MDRFAKVCCVGVLLLLTARLLAPTTSFAQQVTRFTTTIEGETLTLVFDQETNAFVETGESDGGATATVDPFGNIKITDVRPRWWGSETVVAIIAVDMRTARPSLLDSSSSTQVAPWLLFGSGAVLVAVAGWLLWVLRSRRRKSDPSGPDGPANQGMTE